MANFAERLTWLVTTVCAALGAYGRRIASPPQPVWLGTRCYVPRPAPEPLPRLPTPLWNLFIARLQRSAARIAVLYAAWRAGTLPPARPRAPRTPPRPPQAPAPRLPRAFAWANRRARELAAPAGLLNTLLQEPDGRDFLTAVPRAARHIRPLCQALGLPQPDWLRLPPRLPKPRLPKPRPPKPRRERPPALTDPSLRLAPNLIAAARHARKNRLG
jgi:hypothetical protein